MTDTDAVGPARDRIELLDALRGFALGGILLANMLYWAGWYFVSDAERAALASPRQIEIEHWVHAFLIDGKFYTIFSLLFGIGFALQLERLTKRGADGVRIYRRRVLVLLGFGLIHVTLIWDGDILTLYALLGLLLPFFRKLPSRTLLVIALGLMLLPLIGLPLFQSLGWAPHEYFYGLSRRIAAQLAPDASGPLSILRREDIGGYFAWVLSGWPHAIGGRLENWRIPKVLGIMLVGMVLGRRLSAGTLLDDRRLMWTTLVAGLAIGLPFTYAYARGVDLEQQSIAAVIGTAPLAFAYAAAFVLAWPRAKRVLGVLAAPGRMALTNYLSDSLLGIIIFYGIGFGLIGRLSPVGFYSVALMIFATQIIVSNWWLRHHAQGPMEALWRRLTYAGLGHGGARHATV